MTENRGTPENEQLNPLALARDEWRDVYHNGSYTSLLMLDFWIKQKGITYEDYLQDPASILDQDDLLRFKSRVQPNDEWIAQDDEFPRTRHWLSKIDDADFDRVIEEGTGRCTSFAIQTVRALNEKHKDIFDFKYYRVGNHHLARCEKTNVVIDSTHEPKLLEKGGWIINEPTTDTYKRKFESRLPSFIISHRIPQHLARGKRQVGVNAFSKIKALN
jgi:hypothetical protein